MVENTSTGKVGFVGNVHYYGMDKKVNFELWKVAWNNCSVEQLMANYNVMMVMCKTEEKTCFHLRGCYVVVEVEAVVRDAAVEMNVVRTSWYKNLP